MMTIRDSGTRVMIKMMTIDPMMMMMDKSHMRHLLCRTVMISSRISMRTTINNPMRRVGQRRSTPNVNTINLTTITKTMNI